MDRKNEILEACERAVRLITKYSSRIAVDEAIDVLKEAIAKVEGE
jgi:hypothetical protein